MEFSYAKMLGKGAKYALVFLIAALPFIFELVPPEIKQMSILELIGYAFPLLKTVSVGAILVMVLNYLKVKQGLKI